MTVTVKDYRPIYSEDVTWCAGCGDYGILAGLQQALAKSEIEPHRVMIFSGIGCGSKLPDYIRTNGWQTLHGRALPAAQGFKLANHSMTVLAVTGDGDGLGEGGNHWIHAMRRNINFTHILQNNQTYGLTKGQASPTSDHGYISSTTPEGLLEYAINPLAMAIASGACFVARTFSGDVKNMVSVIQRAIAHPGYALVDILQPCVTWNRKEYTYEWFRERIYDVNAVGHTPDDRAAAFARCLEWGDKIPMGIFYESTDREPFEVQSHSIKMDLETPVALRGTGVDAARFEALKQSLI